MIQKQEENCSPRMDMSLNMHSHYITQSHIVDISKFIDLLGKEEMTVSGGRPVVELPLHQTTTIDGITGFGRSQNYTYIIKGAKFEATVKYSQSSQNRVIDLFTIISDGEKISISGNCINHQQGELVLQKCDAALAANVAKMRLEQQGRFDKFMSLLTD